MKYDWTFPLPRTHTGMLQGNGVMGVMIWGEANVLRITVNRADFWDHRGGRTWSEGMNFATIRRLLEAGDAEGLQQAFAFAPPPAGEPTERTRLPLGRLELVFDPSWRLSAGTLDMCTGQVTVRVGNEAGQTQAVELDLAMDRPLLAVHMAGEAGDQAGGDRGWPTVRHVTAWQHPVAAERLRATSFDGPTAVDAAGLSGWVQARPAAGDEPLCVGYRTDGASRTLWLAIDYGRDAAAAQQAVATRLDEGAATGRAQLRQANAAWWASYWADVPTVELPDANLAFLYHYGMYKFAGLTQPAGIAAGLQGAWVEEYQMPPWSADYHFNINVQMCYQPAYAGNRLEHLRPLFRLIESWLPTLRENARRFVGIDDGIVLPHAVDDRCHIIGTFWTGTIDHACTGWVAKMMYDYWLYGGGDEEGDGGEAFLRQTAYPLLHGAMRVYEEMLERDDAGRLTLPVSVSPEYRGAAMNAWGRNASFQLACIHALIRALRHCCEVLGKTPRPVWGEIERDLPLACVEGEGPYRRIHLWQGTDLEESHRHHSHLAGLTPFDVIDPADPQWRDVVANSINRWTERGMGLWSGWCVPWAAMLHHRVGNPDMAVLLLEIWRRVFTNEGHGTLHDCAFPGFTLLGGGVGTHINPDREIMQMDAGMGATAAILDGLAHTRQGVLYLFPGSPAAWRDVSFANLRTAGAFLVSAARRAGRVESVQVRSERGNMFHLDSPWPGGATVRRGDRRERLTGDRLAIATTPGETLTLEPPADR